MTIQTSAGTTLAVTAAGTLPDTFDEVSSTGYPSETYTTVGEITNIPAFGGVYQLITHEPVAERAVVKKKGSVNYGNLVLPFAADADDTGQTSLKTSHTSDSEIAVKVTYPDGEVDYFTALVMDFQREPGGVNSIKGGSVTLELTRPIVNVAAP